MDKCVKESGSCIGGCKDNTYFGSKCKNICSCGDQCDENGRCPDGVTGLTTPDDDGGKITPDGVGEQTTPSGGERTHMILG